MRLDQKLAVFGEQALFRTFEPEALHVLAFSAEARTLAAGEELFHQGETASGGFLIVSGRVSVSGAGIALSDGDVLGRGGLIGQAALLAPIARPQTAVALEPTVVLVLPQSLMRRVLEDHPASARSLHAYIAGQVAEIESQLKRLA